ncbi:methionine ABC transporter permease [Clostridium luticellarii]|jgi:D-methionine transport system permease protein|uniref:Methionine import system permease protein MetP n=1 Tax=Clostridium luticellarii TaxID=1691940 RepID=A0A2T0BNZ6_9CLOT|nr:methionine ABC transporter permease [Clostridium luticellarii]MCI1945075.1 ABC transporter permease [Clostridium luticellarii]MCI1968568.1 ABC transporter permease [Clostridium luticellarii]MCI1996830.1 ABC transporter permease [Clostridium luticellarii]MCI2041101.1 ABC transporter permease [Clostridium luticellarii]PRR85590.1 Methionine import system permease protein MetP [Clostridium luticellarii]
MSEFLAKIAPNLVNLYPEMIKAIFETFYMVAVSGIISTVAGTIMGITLVVTQEGGILENRIINSILGKIINIFRSIPFIILLAAIIPLTRLLVGTTIGTKGALVPLIFGCTPFIARQIESALLEIDKGVIEAAQSMGSGPLGIIFRVMLLEGLPGIIHSLTITIISLIGLSAMAGTVGGGGLGDFAIRYGYQYFQTDIMVATIIVLLIIVNIIQFVGDILSKITTH